MLMKKNFLTDKALLFLFKINNKHNKKIYFYFYHLPYKELIKNKIKLLSKTTHVFFLLHSQLLI